MTASCSRPSPIPPSPSAIACRAAGLTPRGMITAPISGRCATCGVPHAAGDKVMPFSPSGSFTDWSALRCPSSAYVCAHCDAMFSKTFTQTHTRAVMTEDGIFPASSNDHKAAWLLDPPYGAWIWVFSEQSAQHVAWKAPVNTGREMFQIQYGDSVLTIRRQHLIDGAQAVRELIVIANKISAKKRVTPFKSPFTRLSRDMDAFNQGALQPSLLVHAQTDPTTRALVRQIQCLTAGELWGLTATLYAKSPVKPEAKILKETAQ